MKALVSLPALTDDHPNVESALGEGWLDRRVAAAREAMRRRSNLSPSMIGMTTGKLAHPLVDDIYQATDSSGAKVRQTLQLDLLELDLRGLAGNFPSDLTNRLRNEQDATKAIYELRIAAGFTRFEHRGRSGSAERDAMTIAVGLVSLWIGFGLRWIYFDLVGHHLPRNGTPLTNWC